MILPARHGNFRLSYTTGSALQAMTKDQGPERNAKESRA